MQENIIVKGARENNLKNIDVSIPRDKLTVITGLSGSGKSSLAFDTIYAEGQRRYVESLSSYARMFLGQKEKPDVDYIDGLSPAISIDQKTTSQNPRSTVGTVTEIYDYLRLLWARVGTPHCPNCGKEIKQQTIDQIVDQVMALGEGTRIQVMAPVIRGKEGRVRQNFRGCAQVRLCPRARGREYVRSERGDQARKEHQAQHRGRGRPPHSKARCGASPERLGGDRRGALGRTGAHQRAQSRAGYSVLAELCLRGLRRLHRGADAADVLVQQSLRRVPGLYGSRQPAQGRSGAGHSE